MDFGAWMFEILARPWVTTWHPYRNICSIPGCLLVIWGLSSYFLDSYRFSWIFKDFHVFHGFCRFSKIFIDFGAWMFENLAWPWVTTWYPKPLLGSRLASCYLKTFIVFVRDFHGFWSMDVSKPGPALSYDQIPLKNPLLDSRLVSCHLSAFIAFLRFFMDFRRLLAGWLAARLAS